MNSCRFRRRRRGKYALKDTVQTRHFDIRISDVDVAEYLRDNEEDIVGRLGEALGLHRCVKWYGTMDIAFYRRLTAKFSVLRVDFELNPPSHRTRRNCLLIVRSTTFYMRSRHSTDWGRSGRSIILSTLALRWRRFELHRDPVSFPRLCTSPQRNV